MTPPTNLPISRGWMVEFMSDCENEDRFPVRKNPRLKEYDYASPNYYFVTICTWGKRCIFGAPGNRNAYGQIAEAGLQNIPDHFPSVKLDKYVVMPNHVHAILVLTDNDVSLPVLIGQYKAYVTKQIHNLDKHVSVWQTSFHDHVIRNQQAYEKIWLYIESNPGNWLKDCFYTEELSEK